jgi:glucose dehydrogenase
MRNWVPAGSSCVDLRSYACALSLLVGALTTHPLLGQRDDDNVDWRYHGNTLDNQRFQDVDQINPHNVAKLKPAWIFHTGVLGDPNMAMEMTPIVVNGVMLFPPATTMFSR